MTGIISLDIVLILIMEAATIWYIYSIKDDVINIIKKKTYILYIYHEGTQRFEVITKYKERSMRNAMTEHFLSYERDLALLYYKPYMDYNEFVMNYTLTIDGDVYQFTMIQEIEGVTIEQR
ncbi:MAG: hypothetical protein ACI35O_10275 [Bacillaceae bacterium]